MIAWLFRLGHHGRYCLKPNKWMKGSLRSPSPGTPTTQQIDGIFWFGACVLLQLLSWTLRWHHLTWHEKNATMETFACLQILGKLIAGFLISKFGGNYQCWRVFKMPSICEFVYRRKGTFIVQTSWLSEYTLAGFPHICRLLLHSSLHDQLRWILIL